MTNQLPGKTSSRPGHKIRPSKCDYYLAIAEGVAQRSPCLKMQVGAVLVKHDAIISTGYNGPARGEKHCKICARKDVPSGSAYGENCPAVHAEENAIINAARQGNSTVGSVLYLWTSKGPCEPCYRCERAIINAGIADVIIGP